MEVSGPYGFGPPPQKLGSFAATGQIIFPENGHKSHAMFSRHATAYYHCHRRQTAHDRSETMYEFTELFPTCLSLPEA